MKNTGWTVGAVLVSAMLGAAPQSFGQAGATLHWDRVAVTQRFPSCRILRSAVELSYYVDRRTLKPNYPPVNWNNTRLLLIIPGDFAPTYANLEGGIIHVSGTPESRSGRGVIIAIPSRGYDEATGCTLDDRDGQPVATYDWTVSLDSALSSDGSEEPEERPHPKDQRHAVAPRPGFGPQ